MTDAPADSSPSADDGDEAAVEAVDPDLSPLAYALRVMRDPRADPARRDRMSIACLPFLHRRMADHLVGKKEEAEMRAEAALRADAGRFRPQAPPTRIWRELLDIDRPPP